MGFLIIPRHMDGQTAIISHTDLGFSLMLYMIASNSLGCMTDNGAG